MPSRALVVWFMLGSLGCSRSTIEHEPPPTASRIDEDDALRTEVLAWADAEAERWNEAQRGSDEAAGRAQWAEVAAAIARETDPDRRAWMLTGQFMIGHVESGATIFPRAEIAEAVLAELGFDDRHWSIAPYALATAVYETGRWMELRAELGDRISTQHAEVAAYLTLELYTQAIADGEWDRGEAIWAAWSARPELAQTQWGPIVHAMGPERRLAPGNFIPDVCVDRLEGGGLCTAEIDGLTVIELWSIGCKGCRRSIPVVRDAREALHAAYPDDPPDFLSIDVHDEPAAILEFQRETPMPWTNAWVPEHRREHFDAAFERMSIPVLLLVGPDGRILDSTPSLRADNVEARVHHFRSR